MLDANIGGLSPKDEPHARTSLPHSGRESIDEMDLRQMTSLIQAKKGLPPG